jgi:ABC-2 type transport system ATP-binding protein
MRLEAVGKRYGLRQPWIVRDVSRDVAAGKLIRLEGRNGSGKSTLLRVMAGVLLPSAGRVTGRPHAGYVPERFPGGLAFSAREYLTHMSRIHGLSGPGLPAAVDDWLERLGATEYAAAPLRTLSKGMCQKVAIAQALVSRPGLLVLDEAWTGLDQAARGALDAAVAERLAEGGTVLFVDHDPARLAGRVDERWQLGDGRVTVVAGGARAGVTAAFGGNALARGGSSPGRAAAADGGAADAAVTRPSVIIELAGLEAGSLGRLGAMPGVLSTAAGAAPRDEPLRKLGLVRLTVSAADTDRVLRQLLSWDGVHIMSVCPEPEAGQ